VGTTANLPPKPLKWLFWIALVGASVYYLADTLSYAFYAEGKQTDAWPERVNWRFAHFIAAVPLLFIAPLQFSRRVRLRWPKLHRRAGQVYLIGAMIGGLTAIYLAITIKYEGSHVPLTLFGSLWFVFSVAAWQCARRRDFTNHQRFVVRGYALAMAFVWVRIMGQFQSELFPFIESKEVRDTTREWLSVAGPLIVTETWFSWWPAIKRAFAAQKSGA
jgi:uncharacterized membrane protein